MSSIILNIPETITVITKQIIDDHVTEEGRDTLAVVEIPKHIVRIDDRAFEYCSSLEEVIFLSQSSLTEIGYLAFNSCKALKNIILPDTVTIIDRAAFSSCKSLKKINLPNKITSIPLTVFEYCSSLEEVILPESLIDINERAFDNCSSLKHVVLPNSIDAIYGSAFANCESLVYIYLPESLDYIEDQSFQWCSSLSVVAAPKTTYLRPLCFRDSMPTEEVSQKISLPLNDIIHQRFDNLSLHQACYDPHLTVDYLAMTINQMSESEYVLVDSFSMNALHIICTNPSSTYEMISKMVATCPSWRSMKSIEGLTPVMMYIKSKYGHAANDIVENKERLCLDDFMSHSILRQDDIAYMLALDDQMQEELRMLDIKDENTGLYPFMKLATSEYSYSLESLYWLFRAHPHHLSNIYHLL